MYGKVDLTQFACQNRDCRDFTKKGPKHVRVKEVYGPRKTAFIACRTCKRGYAETRGTPFYHLRIADDQLVTVLKSLSRNGGVRGTAEVANVDQNTVMRIARVAGTHAKKLHDHLVRDLKVDQVQADEIYTFVAKKGPPPSRKRKA